MRPLQGRCLVLDDDRQVIKAWRAMLEAWGVTAAYATTTAEAAIPDIARNNSRRDCGATCPAGAVAVAAESLALGGAASPVLGGVEDFVGSGCCMRQLRG